MELKLNKIGSSSVHAIDEWFSANSNPKAGHLTFPARVLMLDMLEKSDEPLSNGVRRCTAGVAALCRFVPPRLIYQALYFSLKAFVLLLFPLFHTVTPYLQHFGC